MDPIVRSANVPMAAPAVERDLPAVKEGGTLTVLAPYNSTTYFIYRGEPLGYEYELLQAFAREQGVELKMVVVSDPKSLLPLLNSGEGDIAAGRLVARPETRADVAFTSELYRTEPALVQQEAPPEAAGAGTEKALQPGPADETPPLDIQARLVTRPDQLSGKTVTVPEQSPYRRDLLELSDEIDGSVYVVEMGGPIQDDALAQKVARGEVQFTVMQGNLAELKEAEFKNLKVRPVIGRSHSVSWAVRKNSPQLLAALNSWIAEKKNGALFDKLYQKYFIDRRGHLERIGSGYLTSATGKLCEYDDLLKRYATELGWDWRLLASQAYQESRFKPEARSWAGATGLLQLMPRTAKEFGVTNVTDPEDNVRGAIRFLQWLTKYWGERIEDENERLKFILASYNAGAGHVEDAQRLTEKYGGDPRVWDDVAYWLLQKSTQQYSTDEVVRFGFCRGLEPVNYVSHILERFERYRQFLNARRGLALDPDLAVLEELLLPDGDRALEFLDGPLARLEGGAAVGGAHRDDDRRFADVGAARAVDDADVLDVEEPVRLPPEAAHLGERHRRVSLVDQIERAATPCPLARVAVERDGGAAARGHDAARDRAHVNRLGRQLEEVRRAGLAFDFGAAADGREDGDLFAFADGGV
ncbi:MAG TPA: transporter substrate-binding domain-containing protein [Pyrinomonadaceae bacterium]|nr:transporter substrate-binding domain-containing protein [Pyrinomonadaceae bacterium]